MTTQTEVLKHSPIHATESPIKFSIRWVVVVLLILSLAGVAIFVLQPKDVDAFSNQQALESISARYQGMADAFNAVTVKNPAALASISSRYQGMAELFAGQEKVEANRALTILSTRYEGMADAYNAVTVDTFSALKSISSRYQGMAELFAGQEKVEANRALTILSTRYQGMADAYNAITVNNPGALASISSRYQGMAVLFAGQEKVEAQRALTILSNRYQALADLYTLP